MIRFTRAALLAATVLSPAAVHAQDADDGANSDDAGNVIIVTARKKEESLQSIPVTVSALSEETIDEANIAGLNEISDFTPGFQIQSAFGRDADRPIIRGASNIIVNEGKVGYFIDGVPFIGSATALDLENFSRVEVVKGPQSAVFGRGTLSGAVNFVSKGGADELAIDFEGTIAQYNSYKAFARVAVPVAEGISVFGSASYDKFGGSYTNIETGEDLGRESLTLAAGVKIESGGFDGSVMYLRSDIDDDHFAIGLQDSSYNNVYKEGSRGYYKGIVKLREPINLNTDDLSFSGLSRLTDRIIATGRAELGDSGFIASALFGYTHEKEQVGTDSTFNNKDAYFIGAFAGPTSFNTVDGRTRRAYSAEMRIATPLDRRIRAEVGGFFFDDQTVGSDFALARTEFGYDSITETREITNLALFGSMEFDVTDRLTLGAELRVARDEIGTRPGASYRLGDYFTTFVGSIGGVPNNANTIIKGTGSVRNQTFKSILPRFTADFQINPDALVYAVYSEGNSPGGFNNVGAPESTFDEETLKNYEIGLKTTPLPGVLFNVAAFFNEYGDQVLSTNFTPPSGGAQSYNDNVGDTEMKGLEFETSWRPTDWLTLSGTYAYIDAEIVRGVNLDQAILLGGRVASGTLTRSTGAVENTTTGCTNLDNVLNAGQRTGDGTLTTAPTPCSFYGDITGKRPPLVSKHQASFSTAIEFPMGGSDWDIFARGDLIYRSSWFAQIHNLAETGDSLKANFAAGVKNDSITVRLWVKNAFKDKTVQGILRYVDFAAPRLNGDRQRAFGVTPPEQRQIGLTVSANF